MNEYRTAETISRPQLPHSLTKFSYLMRAHMAEMGPPEWTHEDLSYLTPPPCWSAALQLSSMACMPACISGPLNMYKNFFFLSHYLVMLHHSGPQSPISLLPQPGQVPDGSHGLLHVVRSSRRLIGPKVPPSEPMYKYMYSTVMDKYTTALLFHVAGRQTSLHSTPLHARPEVP
jgi:hypothetical protein